MKSLRARALTLALVFCVALTLAAKEKDFIKPDARPAKTYSMHDAHPEEQVAIAVDPYDTPEKAKIFSLNFRDHDLVPIFFIITNDGAQPISIANMQVTVTTAQHAKLTPLASEDISRRLSNPQANTNSPIPYPIPHKKVTGTLNRQQLEEIESSQFVAKAVEPHNTQSGFLFFDIAGLDAPLSGALVDITGVRDAKGSELMYFEIPLGK